MMGKTLSSMRDKPLIRCENCAKKAPEESKWGHGENYGVQRVQDET